MALYMSSALLMLYRVLLPHLHPVGDGVRDLRVRGVTRVQYSEDLVSGTVQAVAQEQRSYDEERQECPPRPLDEAGPVDPYAPHAGLFMPFRNSSTYPWRVYFEYDRTTTACQEGARSIRESPRRVVFSVTQALKRD